MRKIHDAGEYSIIFDETTDVSHRSQLSLKLDNMRLEDAKVDDEPFFQSKISGIDLGKTVVKAITNKGFDHILCVDIATDGCSMMTNTCGALVCERHSGLNAMKQCCNFERGSPRSFNVSTEFSSGRKFKHLPKLNLKQQNYATLDIPIKIPRTSECQVHHCNIKTTSAEDFYRILVFIPLLDNVLEDLHSRLLKAELLLWETRELPKQDYDSDGRIYQLLQECARDIFPLTHTLLCILLTWPVSVATAERLFSALRHLKTWI
ncbi:hypothetical protein PR048_018137 [Dryococelus australis]|uniref:HAT C-terminal dimerisation domain-containing protein n=1 Tax=Dryococelus australis TaxID=614101 RepID=A0ABQ9HBK6_9NEOP|nr:hypothetical protein PR048_018137 [Dryococelus australis]